MNRIRCLLFRGHFWIDWSIFHIHETTGQLIVTSYSRCIRCDKEKDRETHATKAPGTDS